MTSHRPGRVAVIIGGSRGIGAAVARLAAREGYRVVLTYASREDEAAALVREITEAGGAAQMIRADAASEDDMRAVFEQAAQAGPIGAMVYSAGITGPSAKLAEASLSSLRKVIEVNLTGALHASHYAIRSMSTDKGGEGGNIVFISSRAAARGSAGEYVWYAASKGGLDSLAIGLSKEVAMEGIRVNCVSPGPVATEMLSPERLALGASLVPMQRAGEPEEVAEAVLYLLSDNASYITGANLAVSGGV